MGCTPAAILDGLSNEQLEAARHFIGPIQVIAGPGSGKTETMARRAAYLIEFHGVDPSKLLLTTFTEKAAENLKNRVKKYLTNKFAVENLTIGTIHAVCLRILEDFGIESGFFSRSIRVMDENQAALFVWTNFEEIGLNEFFDEPDSDSVTDVLKIYSQLMEKGTDLEKLANKVDLETDENKTLRAASKTIENYIRLLEAAQALDFSSILRKTSDLLKDATVLSSVREKYKFLMIDEYQDTNPLQDEILRLIAAPSFNLMVIGDDDQSLYRFRGATVTNFLSFEKNVPRTKVVYLSENRRSTPEIVAASILLAKTIPEKGRAEKKLFTANPSGSPVSLSTYETDVDEVNAVAQTIVHLKQHNRIERYADIAILSYSISSIFPKLREALESRGIPFRVKGDKSFIGQPAVKALISGMWFFTRRRGDVKDFTLLTEPIMKFSSERTASELSSLVCANDLIDFEAAAQLRVTSKYDADRLFKLILLRKEILASSYKRGYTDLVDLFFKLITICETLKFLTLEETEESEEALNHIGRFSNFVLSYSDETGSRAFSDFRNYVFAILNRNTDSPGIDENYDAVTIQTIHQSKGLEYPVVFMPGLVDSRIPGTRKDNDVVPFHSGVHKYWLAKNEFENMDSDFKRVLYVGMTRAEKLLYLSHFKKISKATKPSRYIEPLIKNAAIQKSDFTVPTSALLLKPKPKDDKLRISSSHLQYYVFCPTRYKFALKHSVQAPHRGYFAFGSNLHSAIEEASNVARRAGVAALDTNKIDELFEKHWNSYGFLNKGAAEAQKKVAQQRFKGFVQSHKEMLATVKHSEKKFVLEEDNFVLSGKIDAITSEKKNDLIIIDFKAGAREKFEQEPESSFVEYQGNIYVEAVERTLGVVPSNYYLHFLGENQANESDYKWSFDVTSDSRKKVMTLLNDTAERIKSNDFAPISEPDRCKSCEFKNVCPYSAKKAA
jgi:DNA helicase II / ATP-dependent DNA helicase PcrA